MVSDHILKIVIEAEDRATAALERIEAIMKRLGLVGTESFNKASGGSTKFSESVLKANSPLDSVQKHLKTIGVTGVQSFNQLSVSERKTLLEMSSLSNEAREVMQRLNEVGVNGRNTWNQLSQSQQKALTSMNSLSQSAIKVTENISNSATISKEKMSGLSGTIQSVKEKVMSLGNSARESISTKFGGAVTSAKEKLGSLKGSISSASTSMKTLNQSTQSAGSGMGFLRSAASMTVGMIGYDLVNSIMEASRESINARGNFDAFGKRLGMSSSELKTFSQQCDNLQSTFRKVDMNAVGASALELANKLGLGKENMADLTKMTAVMSSAFVKEGRTQEDAILAVSDAMDGQFRRLQEIGITQDKLKQNGWNGNLQDTASLMTAINTTMDDMGFVETAKGIYTLDDAYTALSVSGGKLLADVLIPFTPIITGVIDGFISLIGYIKDNGWVQAPIIIGLLVTAFVLLKAAAIGAGTTILAMAGNAIPALLTNIPKAISGILALDTAFAPFFIIGAVIAAITIAVYELGIAFGWWTDVGSMIEAIQAGLQRLWAAFINNPDVQGFIKSITFEWNNLCNALKPVTDWLNSVFDGFKQTGSSLDIVRVIIDNLGYAFHYVASIISGIWNNSVGNAIIKLAGLAVGIKVGIKLVRSFVTVLGKLKNFSVSKIKSGFDTIKNTISTTKTKVSDFAQTLKNVGSKFSVSNIKTKLGTLKTALVETGGKAKELGSRLLTAGKNALIAGANAIKSAAMWAVEKGAKVASAIASYAMEAAQWALNLAMNANPIGIVIIAVTALVGILIYLYQNCEPVRNIINELSEIIQNSLVIAFEFLQGCINNTLGFFQWLYNCIVNIPTAAANMITGIITWFSQLPGLVWAWITSTATKIVGGMTAWVNHGKAKAQVFINAVIGFIKTLPGRVYTYIVNTASHILSGAASWVTNAKNKASAMVSAVTGAITGLPGAVYNEFLNIGSRIVQAGQSVLDKAKQFGANLKNAVLNALGIHSPGIIQEKIATEFANIPGRIVETGKSVYDSAKEYGSRILEGFRTNDMSELNISPSMNTESSDIPTSLGSAVIGAELDTSGVATGMNDTNNIVSSGFNNMLLSEQTSMSSMVSDVNSNVGLIQLKEKTSMDTMAKHVDTSMFNILNNTRSSMKSVTSTTQTNLKNMQSSTTKTTSAMVGAWNSMKTSILNVAEKIKSGSYEKFSSLHRTISSFYSQIQSASFGTLAAGPGPNGGSSGRSSVFRMPVNKSTVQSGSGINFQRRVADTIAKIYAVTGLQAIPVGPNGEDLYASFNVNGTANKHINKIMNTAYKWPLKNPKFLGATLPLNYTVGDLKNGKSGRDVLRGLDFENVMNAIWAAHGGWGYSYYFNSRMSPAQAFHGSSFNCYDGAQMVVAIANMMGKSAHMVHGSWNGIGHMGAVVDGKLFDTTQRTKRGVWRGASGVSFGPAPSDPFKNLENAISNLATDSSTGETFDVYTGETVESSELKLTGEFTFNHKVEGLPDTVDSETVVQLLSEATQDKNFIDALVNNMKFQLADLKMKQRIEDKNNRAKGV